MNSNLKAEFQCPGIVSFQLLSQIGKIPELNVIVNTSMTAIIAEC